MKRRTNRRRDEQRVRNWPACGVTPILKDSEPVSPTVKPLLIAGWQRFDAGVVIDAIDEALKKTDDKIARCHLTHSRRYMVDFEKRHPSGVIPRLLEKDEFRLTTNVLRIIEAFGATPPKDSEPSSN